MKTIAVAVHSLTIEYTLSILNGISDYFKQKDIRLVISQIKPPASKDQNYEYQSFSSLHSILSDQVDGIIILAGNYNTSNTLKSLTDVISKADEKPVVSISVPVPISNSATVTVNDTKAYEKIITHMHKDHGAKNFAFFGCAPELSAEGKHRFECFKKAMKKNHLTFNEDLFFYGNYTKSSAEAELNFRLKKKTDVNFDCIIAANDIMAIAVLNHMQKLGIKVPAEVKIIGYDNTSHSKQTLPLLSTIDQNLYDQGQEAAKIIYKKTEGKKVSKLSNVYSYPILRESCGCSFNFEHTFSDTNSKYQLLSNGAQSHFLSKLSRIFSLFDMTKASDTLNRLFYSLPYMMEHSGIRSLAVCFMEQPLTIGRRETFVLPDKMNLNMFIDLDYGIAEFEPDRFFNPKKELLPAEALERAKGNYILHPIYSGELNYGYVMCRLENEDYAVYSVAIRIIVNALSQAYEYSNRVSENTQLTNENKILQKNNSTLNKETKTDELTRLLNRRGFMELGQNHIDMSIESGDEGLVFFSDLDGLKKINDSFGHKMGDAAIKAAGSVLSQVLRANDIVGRLSGDEFGGVATGMNTNLIEKVRNEARKLCEDISKQHEFPFTLSVSIGFAKFDAENKNLKDLLEEADKMLYEEKKIKHSRA